MNLCLEIEKKPVPLSKEALLSLGELIKREKLQVHRRECQFESYPTVETIVQWLNDPSKVEIIPKRSETEAPDTSTSPLPDFRSMNDCQRAVKLRETITKFLKGEIPGFTGTPRLSISEIVNDWNTGLSRGAVYRHFNMVLQELRSAGVTLRENRNRYWISQEETTPPTPHPWGEYAPSIEEFMRDLMGDFEEEHGAGSWGDRQELEARECYDIRMEELRQGQA